MPGNWREWARQIRVEAAAIPDKQYMPLLREAAFRALEWVVQSTPVDTGRARNGWHVTLGTPSGQDHPAGEGLGAVLAAGKKVIDGAQFDGKAIILQNNVPYVRVLDEGLFVPPDPGPSKDPRPGRKGRILVEHGYSVQAPRGMVADALQLVKARYGLA